jgi:hypothetical protein
MFESLWDWLRDPANREVLYLIGAAGAAVVGAGWAVVKFAFSRRSGDGSVSARDHSIASGRDTTIGGDHRGAPPRRKRSRD